MRKKERELGVVRVGANALSPKTALRQLQHEQVVAVRGLQLEQAECAWASKRHYVEVRSAELAVGRRKLRLIGVQSGCANARKSQWQSRVRQVAVV